MSTAIKTVGVVGTGVIGCSWAALFLARGLRVLVSDPAPGAEDHLKAYLKETWPTMERLGLAPGASISNCKFVGADLFAHCHEVDFIQENAPERLEIKRGLFAKLDEKARPEVVIASSSSGLPSSQFITECKTPERILIGHPFNPPHLMPLVEVVPHPGTDNAYVQQAMQFYNQMGKRPVLIKAEAPGFVANRLQAALNLEAYSLVARGIISAEDCDTCVTTGIGLRWAFTGPLMTNVLGGGGNKDSFEHMIEHLGPAIVVWKKDMDAHAFEFAPENKQKLNDQVQVYVEHADPRTVEKQRDDLLIETINLKSQTDALV